MTTLLTIPHRWRSTPCFVTTIADDDPYPMRTAVMAAIAAGADLTGAVGLPSAPVVKNLNHRILERIETQGCRIEMSSWQTECGSSHCIGGWIVHEAGDAGEDLKNIHGYSYAAALIFAASCPGMPIPDFGGGVSNDCALADLRARAAMEVVDGV